MWGLFIPRHFIPSFIFRGLKCCGINCRIQNTWTKPQASAGSRPIIGAFVYSLTSMQSWFRSRCISIFPNLSQSPSTKSWNWGWGPKHLRLSLPTFIVTVSHGMWTFWWCLEAPYHYRRGWWTLASPIFPTKVTQKIQSWKKHYDSDFSSPIDR